MKSMFVLAREAVEQSVTAFGLFILRQLGLAAA